MGPRVSWIGRVVDQGVERDLDAVLRRRVLKSGCWRLVVEGVVGPSAATLAPTDPLPLRQKIAEGNAGQPDTLKLAATKTSMIPPLIKMQRVRKVRSE